MLDLDPLLVGALRCPMAPLLLDRPLAVSLVPSFEYLRIPLEKILQGFMAMEFRKEPCRAVLEEAIRERKLSPELFDLDELGRGGFVAGPRLLYPTADSWSLVFVGFVGDRKTWSRCLHLSEGPELAQAAEFLRLGCRDDEGAALEAGKFLGEAVLRRILSQPVEPRKRWPPALRPGIYRREHASLLICSKTTRLLFDPVVLIGDFIPNLNQAPQDPGADRIDAVFISHFHTDHWHIPSLLRFATPKTPIVTPHVAHPNVLTPRRFEEMLAPLGQAALAPSWGETLVIGDIEIDILPFYGEQPTRRAPGPPPGIRSWGSCFRVSTPEFSAMLLVDSGADHEGDMLEVVAESYRRRGPVDVFLSCARRFASPFFLGLPLYWVTLSFSRLTELFKEYQAGCLPDTTAGPDGVAELCRRSGARYYLPYAHGFFGCGRPVEDIGWRSGEPTEAAALAAVAAALASRGASTKALAWNPGDVALFGSGGELTLCPYAS